jgi:hypothetical protein
MRLKRKAKQLTYILIGGFSYGDSGNAPTITLNKGNGYGEQIVKVLQRFPHGTKYKVVTDRAKELAAELKVTLGRNFTSDEWLGPNV